MRNRIKNINLAAEGERKLIGSVAGLKSDFGAIGDVHSVGGYVSGDFHAGDDSVLENVGIIMDMRIIDGLRSSAVVVVAGDLVVRAHVLRVTVHCCFRDGLKNLRRSITFKRKEKTLTLNLGF